MKIALIISGSYKEVIDWVRKNKLCLNDYKYIRKSNDYLGFHNIPIFLIGQYWLSPLNPITVAKEIQDEN